MKQLNEARIMNFKVCNSLEESDAFLEGVLADPKQPLDYKVGLAVMEDVSLTLERVFKRLVDAKVLTPDQDVLSGDMLASVVAAMGRGFATVFSSGIVATGRTCEHVPPCEWLNLAELMITDFERCALDQFNGVFLKRISDEIPKPDINAPAAGRA
jgi:hypothetical protein